MTILCPICKIPARFWLKHPDADLYRCDVCTHAFSDISSMPKQEEYGPEYFDDTHKRWFENPNTDLFDRVAALIPRGGSVLDVGCGRGDFLRYVLANLPDVRLTGIDFSPNQHDTIRFLQGDIVTLHIAERFDVVVSLSVIEHVPNCMAFVQRMAELTKVGGATVVNTPNEDSILYGLGRAGRAVGVPLAFNRLYSKHHLHHFTPRSLRKALETCGLTVQQFMMHNAPVKAMDMPVSNPAADALLRAGVWAVFAAGSATSKTYMQTVACTL
jgi:2-polyprenyl-3-methyl-5-hydroxy-6-metoxy-1,4-benzoquinol methylase